MIDSNSASCDVVVVGGGPVGLALTLELSRRGHHVAVVEQTRTLHQIPKGQNITNRSMEILHFLGTARAMREARPLPESVRIGGVTAYDNLMGPHWNAGVDAPGRGAAVAQYFFCANDRMPQYVTEAALRSRLEDCPNVERWLGWEAVDVKQSADSATVTIVDADGSRRELDAAYVVGCDGAHSAVREAAGIDSTRDDFERVMVLAVFRSRQLDAMLNRFPPRTTYRVVRSGLDGYWEFFGRVNPDSEFFFHAPVALAGERADVDVVKVMERSVGAPFECELLHVGYWNLRISIAETYASGRVLIAGDAAHSHPPYGGFGLNSGLEDAANLGWKLDGALRGWAGPGLLESYGLERRPVFVGIRDLIVAGIEADREFVGRAEHLNDVQLAEAWEQHCSAVRDWHYVPHYGGSPLHEGFRAADSGVDGRLESAARAGDHLTPCQLSDGSNVYDHFDTDFTLLAFDAEPSDVDGFSAAAQGQGVPLVIVRDDAQGSRADYESDLILVRPDQYVAWAREDGASPDAVLRRATGHTAT